MITTCVSPRVPAEKRFFWLVVLLPPWECVAMLKAKLPLRSVAPSMKGLSVAISCPPIRTPHAVMRGSLVLPRMVWPFIEVALAGKPKVIVTAKAWRNRIACKCRMT
ncbi:hypothetical protein D3C71_1891230 [compost metagenome]